MAFLGLVKVFDPNLVNLNDYRTATPAQRMNAAFSMAHERLGIPRFLDVAGKFDEAFLSFALVEQKMD